MDLTEWCIAGAVVIAGSAVIHSLPRLIRRYRIRRFGR